MIVSSVATLDYMKNQMKPLLNHYETQKFGSSCTESYKTLNHLNPEFLSNIFKLLNYNLCKPLRSEDHSSWLFVFFTHTNTILSLVNWEIICESVLISFLATVFVIIF